ncbi:toxin regulator [Bacillus benzoevorans]|uniref:Putative nucleic acid-binding Zn-ribbon protein n=1 Tax=Bacillus benzoevorans TaxID=1456 RepID=A0A7X0LVJ4_9BACI|nr:toxin regulator [Bacillus benzoevorans]MBB6446066.1 putative nucleic acid-binding Zn-ribbon protein [Bacillus benzoevorans]
MKVIEFLKRRWKYVLTAIIAFIIGAAAGPSQEQLDSANSKVEDLSKQLSTKNDTVASLKSKNKDLKAKVDEAAPWFAMKEEERKQQEAEAKAAEEKRLAEEKAKAEAEAAAKAAAEAEAKRVAEEEAKKGYDTGITYDQLARTPEDFMGQKVKFRGKVVQVMEGDDSTQIRLAVNSDYDTILFAEFDKSIVTSRVLEDDVITIMGVSAGLISYQSTMGGKISIPGISVDKIE